MRCLIFFILFSGLFAAQIKLGNEILTVEIVDNPATRSMGLMGRKELPEGTGMLFVYQQPERLSFWMKNTLIPLSIAFFDEKKAIINILDMDPPLDSHFLHYRSEAPALYALEVPQGWFENHRIGPGVKFSFLDRTVQVK